MNRKGFLAVLLALATSLTMLTACGSDDPEPKVKPSAGYFLTSSSCHPKIFVKEFSYFLMPCHQHGLGVNLLVQR